jgi:hypothetical protein
MCSWRLSQTGLSWTPVRIHKTIKAGITPVQNMTRQPSVESGETLNGSGIAAKIGYTYEKVNADRM